MLSTVLSAGDAMDRRGDARAGAGERDLRAGDFLAFLSNFRSCTPPKLTRDLRGSEPPRDFLWAGESLGRPAISAGSSSMVSVGEARGSRPRLSTEGGVAVAARPWRAEAVRRRWTCAFSWSMAGDVAAACLLRRGERRTAGSGEASASHVSGVPRGCAIARVGGRGQIDACGREHLVENGRIFARLARLDRVDWTTAFAWPDRQRRPRR